MITIVLLLIILIGGFSNFYQMTIYGLLIDDDWKVKLLEYSQHGG